MNSQFFTAKLQLASAASLKAEGTRVTQLLPLVPASLLQSEIPLSGLALDTVLQSRQDVSAVLGKIDDRLLVIVGPCSIHDPAAALDYARRLKKLSDRLSGDLCVVMRAYLEKPRTSVGWKGLINDPYLDESFAINDGLKISRKLFVDINAMGLPVATELLDTLSPQYFADAITFGAIGARTTESQLHRELVSGVSFPVGFKNGTDGGLTVAMDAMKSSAAPHRFLGATKTGLTGIVQTSGNSDTAVILRGGSKGPNFDANSVDQAIGSLRFRGQRDVVIVDCSHGNSNKDYRNQPKVADVVAQQVARGQRNIVGLMLESNIYEGRQDVPASGPGGLLPGVSITDGCIGWDATVKTLERLAEAVQLRRTVVPAATLTPEDSDDGC
ncbi:phospho-2-dehydro-3-deoxyheptonate aldolase [Pyrenophora seminiperda CCB06]|uniref:Phospho-2-dehydro-3-deoxyheptonate aldolase n=1 Tax=Pyrenophora seminiperda CCB06 TaxID=1302712 RepID=A0A3M7M680_9PLEO|nr:phospho-2-dehydro-3-deoxyheptonate aldolase [Pyrenophora seminiperda CCB06]